MEVSEENLKRLFRVWKNKNYTLEGHPSSLSGQYVRCADCGATRDYDEYGRFPHKDGCNVPDEERYARKIEDGFDA